MIHSIVKDKDGYILTGSVKKKIYDEAAAFSLAKNGGHEGLC